MALPHLTRFELRISPKLPDQEPLLDVLPFHSGLDFMKRSFTTRFWFVPDYTKLRKLTTADKEIIREVKKRRKQGRKDWEGVDKYTKDKISSIIKENAVDLWQAFIGSKDELFRWLEHPPNENAVNQDHRDSVVNALDREQIAIEPEPSKPLDR